jgi:hypothetical protein
VNRQTNAQTKKATKNTQHSTHKHKRTKLIYTHIHTYTSTHLSPTHPRTYHIHAPITFTHTHTHTHTHTPTHLQKYVSSNEFLGQEFVLFAGLTPGLQCRESGCAKLHCAGNLWEWGGRGGYHIIVQLVYVSHLLQEGRVKIHPLSHRYRVDI